MRKAKLVGKRMIEICREDFKEAPEADEVLIQVKAVGICGTDIHIFNGERTDVEYPRVMGHELSGIVVETGKDVANVKAGDHVVLDPVMACGTCRTCKRGHENVCESVKCFGVQMDGGFQDYIRVPAKQVYAVSEQIPFEEAAVAEPFSVAANILSRAEVAAGDRVAVIGAGTIGLCIVQGAKSIGAGVLAMDISDRKLEKAKEFGADACVNTKDTAFSSAVEAFAPGGVDVIIDAVGITPFVEKCISLAAPFGRIVVISFDERPARISPAVVTKRELSVLGSRMNCKRMPMVIKWMEEKAIRPEAMISRIYPLEELQKAFEETIRDAQTNIKTIIRL
ncbi:MAG: alcohol dehydrogenase catalytic domain-containing protein [Lachnospiraceae bacterium]|jgi:L-gulonate 5-dehydrogenase|nr:alcohol dehydrogenase catalytic domain-containing protein [Lachnospiraceae bacterium]MCI9681146.1 alcohol dehydrogenase catalytic domain-containing protein [Lachnospiraceae bacterium]